MSETKYESKKIDLGEWSITLVNDEDGDLAVYLSHNSGKEVFEQVADIATENEWAERFYVSVTKPEEGK